MKEIFMVLYLLVIAIYDCYEKKIPDILLIAIFSILICRDITTEYSIITQRTFCSLLFLFIFYLVYKFIGGLGAGDVKLIAVVSYSCGFFETISICIIASFLGIIYCLFYKLMKREKKIKIAFAPFIFVGCIAVYSVAYVIK